MKKLLLLALCAPTFLFAQAEFGYHATWHYSYSEFGYTGFKKIEHVKDTVIQGMDCLKFSVTGVRDLRTGPNPNDLVQDKNAIFKSIYLATRNDSVFNVSENGDAQLLYDFNAQVGESWQIAVHDSLFNCFAKPVATVTSFGTETLDNQILDVINVDFPRDTIDVNGTSNYQINSSATIGYKIYKAFGDIWYNVLFAPSPNTCDGTSFKVMQLSNHTLRCFSNDDISINLTSGACNSWAYISLAETTVSDFKIFPNPSNDFIYIDAKNEITHVELLTIDGKQIRKEAFSGSVELPKQSGMYLLVLHFKDGGKTAIKVLRN